MGIEIVYLVIQNRSYIVDSYQGHVLPQTVLINPNGTIRDVWPGVVEEGREEAIVSVLETLSR